MRIRANDMNQSSRVAQVERLDPRFCGNAVINIQSGTDRVRNFVQDEVPDFFLVSQYRLIVLSFQSIEVVNLGLQKAECSLERIEV